jgi:hypothetical protein
VLPEPLDPCPHAGTPAKSSPAVPRPATKPHPIFMRLPPCCCSVRRRTRHPAMARRVGSNTLVTPGGDDRRPDRARPRSQGARTCAQPLRQQARRVRSLPPHAPVRPPPGAALSDRLAT